MVFILSDKPFNYAIKVYNVCDKVRISQINATAKIIHIYIYTYMYHSGGFGGVGNGGGSGDFDNEYGGV